MTLEELLNDERREGRKELLYQKIKVKLAKGKTVEVIAEELEEDVTVVAAAIRELQNEL